VSDQNDEVLFVRDGETMRAIAAHCSHYHGPLAEGIVVDGTIRCPWHHACFDLRTGAVLRAPAPSPLPVWQVEQRDGQYVVGARIEQKPLRAEAGPESVVIVGAGAAGVNVAVTLRSEGYAGRVVLISRETDLPYDKPNLSKDYMAGAAPPEWLPLHPREYYEDQRIELRLGETVSAVETRTNTITTSSGERISYGALVLATGAAPRILTGTGADIHYLRTRRDAERIVEKASSARRALVIGSSFIGLEVAASLRQKGLAVTVTSPDLVPLERVLGKDVGERIRAIHEDRGVVFRLGEKTSFDDADLIVAGIGVSPEIDLAKKAGIVTADGILVNEYLETSAPGVYACGDVASWPGKNERLRVEHWVVAGRQGQSVARNILGRRQAFDAVPFFWSAHFDVVISYVGHGSGSDDVEIDGSLAANDATITYRRGGRVTAVATIGRDRESLRAELAMEREQPLDRKERQQ
jgi:NADPH-dependent 2,4-dienoyl-CoA reductase/sulfur reductase-like enzyme/nitrite reductase/ring-hydroxylating ferredoxin subunit